MWAQEERQQSTLYTWGKYDHLSGIRETQNKSKPKLLQTKQILIRRNEHMFPNRFRNSGTSSIILSLVSHCGNLAFIPKLRADMWDGTWDFKFLFSLNTNYKKTWNFSSFLKHLRTISLIKIIGRRLHHSAGADARPQEMGAHSRFTESERPEQWDQEC